jgi:hypothetical protein
MHASESPEGKPVVDTLFDVYVRKTGSAQHQTFAIGESGAGVMLVDCSRPGARRIQNADLPTAIGRLAVKLKQGYRRLPRRMFYNSLSGEFTVIHPDLDFEGGTWLLSAVPPLVAEAADQVVVCVSTLHAGLILPEEIGAWRRQQQRNAAHVVAFADHPAWSLALAQQAHEQGWLLRASPGQKAACPDAKPSLSPHEWTGWLSSVFDRKLVLANQAGFGWAVGHERTSIAGMASRSDGGLSALL